jgi:signal transduction histidine kinase
MYDSYYRWRIDAPTLVTTVTLLLGLFSGVLWLAIRDTQFGLIALGVALVAPRMISYVVSAHPLPWPLWGAVSAMAYVFHDLVCYRLFLLIVDFRNRRLDQAIGWYSLVLATMAFAAFAGQWPILWIIASGLLLSQRLVITYIVFRAAWLSRSAASLLLSAALAGLLMAGLHDWFLFRFPAYGATNTAVMPFAALALVLVLVWLSVQNYAVQTSRYRDLNLSLEQRIAQREAELNASHAQLKAQGEQAATLQERQRIMRDIHDGVGAHLVGLLSMVRKGNVPQGAMEEHTHAALDELRIAVDSLQPVNGDLATVLATLRYRLQPRFEAAGLAVVWDVAALPPMPQLTPQVVLQLQRLLMEAFTNVLRHAKATQITVRAHSLTDPAALQLEVADNGVGWPEGGPARHGHGIASMQARAKSIGAQLALDGKPGDGLRLVLRMST